MQGQAYARALEEARKELAAGIPGVMSGLAGVAYEPESFFRVPFLDLSLEVSFPAGRVSLGSQETSVDVTVVVLHYLARSVGSLDLADPVRYQGLTGATAFAAAFRARVEQPLISRFAEDGPGLARVASRLRGSERAGVWQFPFLPHLPLGLRLGEADGIFPPDCVILFPRRAGFVYLVEDLAVAGQLLAGRLLQLGSEEGAGRQADAADLPGLLSWAGSP